MSKPLQDAAREAAHGRSDCKCENCWKINASCADAATEVYEPIIQELLDHHDAMCEGTNCDEVFAIRTMLGTDKD